MKRCPYCGKEYPDDATVCAIDQTPFEEVPAETVSQKFPTFAVFSESKIPASLATVSYLFFIPSAFIFALIGFLLCVNSIGESGGILLPCLISGIVGILIVVFLLIFPVAMLIVYGVVTVLLVIHSIGVGWNNEIILSWLGGAFGIFSLFLSRGLRKCSRGCRTCALVLIWWGFIGLAFSIGRSFLTYVQTYDHDYKSTVRFWILCGLYFIFQVWQYRVLTRPDIRELFYNES
jgi:hypothetical protein